MESPTKCLSLNFQYDEGSTSTLNTPPAFNYDSEVNEDGCNEDVTDDSCDVFTTPNGSLVWFPNVEENLKPVRGAQYPTLLDVLKMYKAYAHACGFSVRIGQQKKYAGIVTHKYLRCNRAGIPQFQKKFESSSSCRQSTYFRNNCKASICVKYNHLNQTVLLLSFHEGHNHSMVEGFNRDLTKISRKLPFATKKFIHDMSLNSVGPIKAHRFMVSMNGGHHNVNGTPLDFKNFSKTTRMFIGDRDTQLVLNRLHERAKSLPDFYFDYVVVDGKLRCLFWADEISKLNYQAFGDVAAFDATYQTNKYDMIFVPFTGVDNHRRCVTFGAGLLFNETGESYIWLLENFLKAHKKQPTIILTDQDLSMKQAVTEVFTESKHRLCMWHIMKKLPSKVSGDVLQNSDLRSQIHRLVWSPYMKPATFEKKWAELIASFSLSDNDWLTEIYAIRGDWVPAYFRDDQMSCLLRTTSVCESSNASFKVNSTSANTLVQFMLCYETRIENQRYKQRTADFKTSTLSYHGNVDLGIEKHAFELYTHTIFKEVKEEIGEGMYYCYISNTEVTGQIHIYSVAQRSTTAQCVNTFKVTYDTEEKKADCSCMCFKRIGYLCRHVFCVYQVNLIHEIPSIYISKRWTRNALPREVYSLDKRYGVDNRVESVLVKEIMEVVTSCVDDFRSNEGGLKHLAKEVKELRERLVATKGDSLVMDISEHMDISEQVVVEDLVGQAVNVDVVVGNPNGIRTKGCGRKRRITGPGEKMRNKPPKAPRLCRTCKEYVTDHDSRNCKKKKRASGDEADMGGSEAE